MGVAAAHASPKWLKALWGVRAAGSVSPEARWANTARMLGLQEPPAFAACILDSVGSTTQIIKAAQTLPNKQFIVATDQGIFFKLQQQAPDKEFIIAPTAGEGATCRSCANCPWMAML